MMILNKDLYNRIEKMLVDRNALEKFLSESFVDVEDYDEELSVQISQAFVQNVVDKMDVKNADQYAHYENLLLDMHEQFGSHNGGCILYDYVPQTTDDIKKLIRSEKLSKLFKDNQRQSLKLGLDFSPRLVYPLNLKDPNFVKKLKQTYSPLFKNAENFSQNESVN